MISSCLPFGELACFARFGLRICRVSSSTCSGNGRSSCAAISIRIIALGCSPPNSSWRRSNLSANSPGNLTTTGLLGNVIWLVCFGWWIALGHLVTAVPLGISIIGLPFAWAHLKLAGLALWPVGRIVVSNEEARGLRARAF